MLLRNLPLYVGGGVIVLFMLLVVVGGGGIGTPEILAFLGLLAFCGIWWIVNMTVNSRRQNTHTGAP